MPRPCSSPRPSPRSVWRCRLPRPPWPTPAGDPGEAGAAREADPGAGAVPAGALAAVRRTTTSATRRRGDTLAEGPAPGRNTRGDLGGTRRRRIRLRVQIPVRIRIRVRDPARDRLRTPPCDPPIPRAAAGDPPTRRDRARHGTRDRRDIPSPGRDRPRDDVGDRPRIHRDIRTRRRRGIRRRGIRRRTHIYRVRGPRAIADDARAGLSVRRSSRGCRLADHRDWGRSRPSRVGIPGAPVPGAGERPGGGGTRGVGRRPTRVRRRVDAPARCAWRWAGARRRRRRRRSMCAIPSARATRWGPRRCSRGVGSGG